MATSQDSDIDLRPDGVLEGMVDDEVRLYLIWDRLMLRYARQGDFDKSEEWAEKILARARVPLLLRAHALMTLAMRVGDPHARGRAEEAIRYLKEVEQDGLKVPPRDWALALKILAWAIEEQARGEPYEAMEALTDEEDINDDGDDDTAEEEIAAEPDMTPGDLASGVADGDAMQGVESTMDELAIDTETVQPALIHTPQASRAASVAPGQEARPQTPEASPEPSGEWPTPATGRRDSQTRYFSAQSRQDPIPEEAAAAESGDDHMDTDE